MDASFFVVCRAWSITWWCKSTMGVRNRQPLVTGKGVHREVESEGSLLQSHAPRNTNHIRHNRWDEIATQIEIQRLRGHRDVNVAGDGMKVAGLTTGGLADMRKRSKKHG